MPGAVLERVGEEQPVHTPASTALITAVAGARSDLESASAAAATAAGSSGTAVAAGPEAATVVAGPAAAGGTAAEPADTTAMAAARKRLSDLEAELAELSASEKLVQADLLRLLV